MTRPPSAALVARVKEAWSVVRPAVARTGRLEPTLVYAKAGVERGVPLRPALFGSVAFLRSNHRLCRETEVFAGLTAAAISRLTPGRWQALVRRRLRAIRPDWMLLLTLVGRSPSARPAATSRIPPFLVVGWEAGSTFALRGAGLDPR